LDASTRAGGEEARARKKPLFSLNRPLNDPSTVDENAPFLYHPDQ
jgi:hypothetical protein